MSLLLPIGLSLLSAMFMGTIDYEELLDDAIEDAEADADASSSSEADPEITTELLERAADLMENDPFSPTSGTINALDDTLVGASGDSTIAGGAMDDWLMDDPMPEPETLRENVILEALAMGDDEEDMNNDMMVEEEMTEVEITATEEEINLDDLLILDAPSDEGSAVLFGGEPIAWLPIGANEVNAVVTGLEDEHGIEHSATLAGEPLYGDDEVEALAEANLKLAFVAPTPRDAYI
ncbi:MAG: hypothetical protein MK098_05465 [Marinovum sp.]|nr:hypothetical protein [Marinovum sp.]